MVGIGRVAPLPCPGRSMRAVLLFVTALLGRKYVAKEAHPERGSTGPAPRSWRIWVVDQTRSLQASTPGPEVGVEQWPEHASSTETSPAAPRAVVRFLRLERQRIPRTSAAPRNPATLHMEQNYGPEGIALWAAGMITVFPGMLLGFLGFACLVASGGHPWQLVTWLYGIGVTLILLGDTDSSKASGRVEPLIWSALSGQ